MICCPHCGVWLDDRARVCATCGNLVALGGKDAVPPAAAPWPPTMSYATGPTTVAYAGFWRRFAAMIIDQLVLLLVNMVVGFVIGFLFALMTRQSDGTAVLGGLVGLLGTWLYYALFESSQTQATPGKMAMGIIVTDMWGRRISFGRATGRHFAKLISGLILCIGYIMAGFTERKQALHDLIADCLVVMRERDQTQSW